MVQSEFSFAGDKEQPRGFSREEDFFSSGEKTVSVGATADKPVEKSLPSVFTVTGVVRLIRLTLNRNLPEKITLTGEISNYKRHSSGHFYLTLKDENSQLACIMWKSDASRLKFRPADGMAVLATGRVDLYEPQGKVQFYIEKLEPAGIGALELAFRQLAEKLRQEGLFDEAHKKSLPKFPTTIAIVTSPTGAAIEDITKTLNRRYPIVRKLLYPVNVQGETAAKEIAFAIRDINRRRQKLGGVDLMIVGRGGGSLEDLWPFNEEIVARAIYDSVIPIISAVGHEVDITISDLVADVRAATPTAAAELAAPVATDLLLVLEQSQQRMLLGARRQCELNTNNIHNLARHAIFTRPLDGINIRHQQLDELIARMKHGVSQALHRAGELLERRSAIVRKIEPRAYLALSGRRLSQGQHSLYLAYARYLQQRKDQITGFSGRMMVINPINDVRRQQNTLAHFTVRLHTAGRQYSGRLNQQLTGWQKRLENLDPRGVLQRGYSITRLKATGRIIAGGNEVRAGDLIVSQLAHNTFIESEVI